MVHYWQEPTNEQDKINLTINPWSAVNNGWGEFIMAFLITFILLGSGFAAGFATDCSWFVVYFCCCWNFCNGGGHETSHLEFVNFGGGFFWKLLLRKTLAWVPVFGWREFLKKETNKNVG